MTSHAAAEPKGPSLGQAAYQAIKRDIIRCELRPGSQVSEIGLAERYGVGRAAVRTALNRLYQERLVQPVPRQGYRITPITLKGVQDLFGARLVVEPAVVRLAAARASAEQLAQLDGLSLRAHYRLGDAESAAAFLRLNTEFHLTVARASGNDRLTEIIAGLLDEMERLFHFGLMLRDRNDEMYHEHQDLVEALAVRDAERAEQVAVEQIVAAQKMVTDALLSSPSLLSLSLAAD